MKVNCGTTRQVIIFDRVVIKVARLDFKKFWQALKQEKEIFSEGEKGLKGYKRILAVKRSFCKQRRKETEKRSEIINLKLPKGRCYEREGSPSFYLLAGIMANLQEFYFSLFFENSFIEPTYFSFFGLINVQKKGDKIDFWNSDDLFNYVCQNSLQQDQPHCDSHVFSNIDNFCIDGCRLKICDYGSRNIQEFLILNGERLSSRFIKPIK